MDTFGAMGWIMYILVTIINIALAFFIFYWVFQLLRRYVFYRSKEVEKDKLQEEIAKLRKQAEELVKEKNKIYAMKVSGSTILGVANAENGAEEVEAEEVKDDEDPSKKPLVEGESRFTKLIDIDKKYALNPNIVTMAEEDKLTLEQVVEKFVNFAANRLRLFYTAETVRIFFSGMSTGRLIILEGISGTGKTSLPYAMGKFFCNNTSIVSVQPSWRDRSELVGFLNDFTKKFNETDFLKCVYEVGHRQDPNIIVLDEMNLARIEYYFAEFLSIMEMPDKSEWKIDIAPGSKPNDPVHIEYGKLIIPPNVWFVGTANNDDSTYTITDKVYDRAVTIQLNTKADAFEAPDTEPYNCSYEYLESLFDKAKADFCISDENLQKLKELDVFIQENFKIAFGNRIMKHMRAFVPTYMAAGGDELSGLDYMIMSKILHKFNALNLPYLGKELEELTVLINKKFGKGKMQYCLNYIKELQKMT